MRTNRTTQVTTRDTHRTWLIRQQWNSNHVQCEQCSEHVQMLTLQEAAAFTRTDQKTVNALMELGKLHWMETVEGLPLICLNSLIQNGSGGEKQ